MFDFWKDIFKKLDSRLIFVEFSLVFVWLLWVSNYIAFSFFSSFFLYLFFSFEIIFFVSVLFKFFLRFILLEKINVH